MIGLETFSIHTFLNFTLDTIPAPPCHKYYRIRDIFHLHIILDTLLPKSSKLLPPSPWVWYAFNFGLSLDFEPFLFLVVVLHFRIYLIHKLVLSFHLIQIIFLATFCFILQLQIKNMPFSKCVNFIGAKRVCVKDRYLPGFYSYTILCVRQVRPIYRYIFHLRPFIPSSQASNTGGNSDNQPSSQGR